ISRPSSDPPRASYRWVAPPSVVGHLGPSSVNVRAPRSTQVRPGRLWASSEATPLPRSPARVPSIDLGGLVLAPRLMTLPLSRSHPRLRLVVLVDEITLLFEVLVPQRLDLVFPGSGALLGLQCRPEPPACRPGCNVDDCAVRIAPTERRIVPAPRVGQLPLTVHRLGTVSAIPVVAS